MMTMARARNGQGSLFLQSLKRCSRTLLTQEISRACATFTQSLRSANPHLRLNIDGDESADWYGHERDVVAQSRRHAHSNAATGMQ